ncbi:hypothetical protein LY71_10990 [Geodermatophilus tzadiensis]|uniref:Uncharacterized protein n=1 Tax=Geodermatophilus tzadiensis TaxID=1137988 RepID=A0A2T0TS35_9ACTN|nr:hypothetical protein [Geodermatophilus tzadiensis]PRY48453.1 hypothetical protein LY71_10990 [Geodermatophilus tzadiensis]
MCGACGGSPAEDWASPVLGSRPARAAAAAVLAAAAARGTAVRAVPGGWTVRRPTGAAVVVGTLSGLLTAAAPDPDADAGLPPAPGAQPPPPDHRRPVTLVHGDGDGAVDTRDAGWAERVPPCGPPLVLAAPAEPTAVLDRLLSDPLRRSLRIAGLVGQVFGPGTAARLPGVPGAVAVDRVPALAALLALRLAGRSPHERTRTAVDVDGTPVVLEALGRRVLSFAAAAAGTAGH